LPRPQALGYPTHHRVDPSSSPGGARVTTDEDSGPTSTELSDRRTEMAMDRTVLAIERTPIAWIRASLSTVG